MDTFLSVKYGTSRGRDTYGYSIVTLVDTDTGKRYRTCGGGYDMHGTVLADWLSDVLQDELLGLLKSRGMDAGCYCTSSDTVGKYNWPYGAAISKGGVAYLDGMTGESNVKAIARQLGYKISSVQEKTRGRNYKFLGYQVSKIEEQPNNDN